MFVIRLKNSTMYLEADDSYTPVAIDATQYGEFFDAKSFASVDEEVVEINEDGEVVWVES